MNNSNVIGIDLAKIVMQVCKVSKQGELTSNKAISPIKLKELLAKSTPSIVAMEGCGTCHYWARLARNMGMTFESLALRRSKPFCKVIKQMPMMPWPLPSHQYNLAWYLAI